MNNSTKKIIKVVAGCALATLVIALIMPKERSDAIKESLLRLTGDAGVACLDYHRGSLKDADSASLIRSTEGGSKYIPTVQITYKAKNSFGAFGTSVASCTMNQDGSVHVKLTELSRENKETLQGLGSLTACLDGKISDLKMNNPLAEANFQVCKMKASLPQ